MARPSALPEYASLAAFVAFVQEDERVTYTAEELGDLAESLQTSRGKVREALLAHGVKLQVRAVEKTPRGFTSNNHNRWDGNECAGGSGWQQIAGFAGNNG